MIIYGKCKNAECDNDKEYYFRIYNGVFQVKCKKCECIFTLTEIAFEPFIDY